MRIQSINNPTSIGIVSFIDECGYFRLKRVTNDEMIELRKENQDLKESNKELKGWKKQ